MLNSKAENHSVIQIEPIKKLPVGTNSFPWVKIYTSLILMQIFSMTIKKAEIFLRNQKILIIEVKYIRQQELHFTMSKSCMNY